MKHSSSAAAVPWRQAPATTNKEEKREERRCSRGRGSMCFPEPCNVSPNEEILRREGDTDESLSGIPRKELTTALGLLR